MTLPIKYGLSRGWPFGPGLVPIELTGESLPPAGFAFVTTNGGQNYVTTNNGADRVTVKVS